MSVNYKVRAAALPADLRCLMTDEQWQDFAATITVELPDGSKINYGNTTPAPADRIWPWFRRNADGTPDRWYSYALGTWLSRHPLPPGMVTLWEGAEANIPTYDGGEAAAITDITGPFWERVTQMDARMPIGPGTLPSTLLLAPGATGGEEKHVLLGPELPTELQAFNNLNMTGLFAVVSAGGTYKVSTTAGTEHRTVEWQGTGTAHNNLPPYTAIWFLRRTGRLYNRAP